MLYKSYEHLTNWPWTEERTDIVQNQGSCKIKSQSQKSTHIVFIVQTKGSYNIVQTKDHAILIWRENQGSCNIVQTRGSCIFNLTSTGKG